MDVRGDHVSDSALAAGPSHPPRGVVLLGASNLAMGLPDVLAEFRRQRPGPLCVVAARGHGRSYANRSRVLLRELPGILECGLWEALSVDRIGSRPDALITDVGNDLVYGATPDALIGWVATCVSRLERLSARILITHLPVVSLERLSRIRFETVRRLLFPAHPLRLERMLEMVRETDGRLADLALARGLTTAVMDPAWYGLDPVHFRVRRRRTAWSHILSPWRAPTASASSEIGQAHSGTASEVAPETALEFLEFVEFGHVEFGQAHSGVAETAPEFGQAHSGVETGTSPSGPPFRAVRRARPERWWFAGRKCSQVQPARRLADGSELWLF